MVNATVGKKSPKTMGSTFTCWLKIMTSSHCMKEVELLTFDESSFFSAMWMVMCLPPPPPHFIANHPFVFLINSIKFGIVLFAGRLSHVQISQVNAVQCHMFVLLFKQHEFCCCSEDKRNLHGTYLKTSVWQSSCCLILYYRFPFIQILC